jgi:hypothetical protein
MARRMSIGTRLASGRACILDARSGIGALWPC